VMGKYLPFVYQFHCIVYFEPLENFYFLLVYQCHYVNYFSAHLLIFISTLCASYFFSSYNIPIFYIIIIFLKIVYGFI